MDGPMLRAWMQDSVPPSTSYEDRPGRWVGEPAWPSEHVRDTAYALRSRHLTAEDEAPDDGGSQTLKSPLSVGQFAGKAGLANAPPDLPYDQREEDGGSLVYETEPLPERLEILGRLASRAG